MKGDINNLYRIVEHTAALTAKVHGVLSKDEIFRIVADELKNAKGHEMVLMLLSEDRKEFVLQEITLSEFQIQAIEKLIGTKVIGFRRPYELVKVFHRVIENQETYTFPTSQFIEQLLDGTVGKMVTLITGHSQKTSTVSPIVIGNEVIGVIGIDTTQENEFQDFFELIVENLAKHISMALELAENNQKQNTAEEKLKKIFENTKDAIASIDQEGNVVAWNQAAEDMFGYSQDEMLGEPYSILVPKEFEEDRTRMLDQTQKHGYVVNYETIREHKNGKRLTVEMTVSVSIDSSGKQTYTAIIRDVTARKLAEKDFIVRNRAMDVANQGIVITDPNLKDNPIIDCNKTFELLTGYTKQEVVGKNCRFLQGPESDPVIVEELRQAVKNKLDYSCEIVNYRKDGSKFWNELVVTGVRNSQGELLNYIGMQADITARKEAHTALEESEFLLKQTQRIAGIGSYVLDFKTGIWTSSPILDKIFGIGDSYERNVEGWLNLVHPDQQNELKSYLENEIIGKQIRFDKEYQIIRNADKQPRWVHGIGELGFDADGGLSIMKGVIWDITERKQQQLEMKKLSTAVEQSPASVVMTDLDGKINYVNPRFEEVTGFLAKKVIGKNPRILKSGHTTKEEYEELWKTITAGKIWVGEFHNRKRDGTLYWEKASIGPIFNEEGKITDFLAVKEDITEMKETQQMLQDTLVHLEDLVDQRTSELSAAKWDLERTHEDFVSSLHYAQRIQQASLPTDAAFKQAFCNSFVLFRPKDIVSGDFYWLYTKEDYAILSVVDCTGHGVPGALMAMAGNEHLSNVVVRERCINPKEILEELDQSVSRLLKKRHTENVMMDGMDLSVVHVDKVNHVLEYSSAQGHGVLIRTNETIILAPDKYSIGGFTEPGFKTFTLQKYAYSKGDRLFLFSDGIYDQFGGAKGKKLLRKHFITLLEESSKMTMQDQFAHLDKFFKDWLGDNVQIDDVTLIGVEF